MAMEQSAVPTNLMVMLLSGVPATSAPATVPAPACAATARDMAEREMGATATANHFAASWHQLLLFTIPECGRSRSNMVPGTDR